MKRLLLKSILGIGLLTVAYSPFIQAEEPLIQKAPPEDSPSSVQLGVPPYYYVPIAPANPSLHPTRPVSNPVIYYNPNSNKPGFWNNRPAYPHGRGHPGAGPKTFIPGQIRIQ